MIHLYFIQAGAGGPIKIGIAVDPKRRMASLQGANPVELRLLATRPGSPELERDMHERFAGGHIRGEWFDLDTPGLLEAIADAKHASDERHVSRREAAARRERIEARAARLAQDGHWDEAKRTIASVSPEDGPTD